MGLFDDVEVHPSRLPLGIPAWLLKCPVFQTYDLGRGMGHYKIDDDGCLYHVHVVFAGGVQKIPYKRKRIELYASNLRGGRPDPSGKGPYQYLTENGEDYEDVTLIAEFRYAVLKIRTKHINSQPAHKLPKKKRKV